MTSRIRLALICMAFSPTLLAGAEPTRKPNVILIVADDLGWADLGCYGSTFHQTPNLDRFAKTAMRFTQGYAACPVCSPTRAALMSGKYPARLHLTDWLPGRGDLPAQKMARPVIRQQLPLEETTLAEAMKTAGYQTFHIGKWHLGGEGFEPTKQGFDVNIGGDHTGTPLSYFAPFRGKKGQMPGLEKAPEGEYLTDRLAAEAVRLIEAHSDKPFFMYCPHFAVHTPMRAKEDLQKKYPAKIEFGKQSNGIYAAMLESLDEAVGRVLKKLDDLKLTENTIVIFTSDNGGLATLEGPNTPATFNGILREGKGHLYEGGVRVPLLVRCPGVTKAGSLNDYPVSSYDLFPTICELCGVSAPTAVDGVSLVSSLKGEGNPKRDTLYWHYPHYSNQLGRPGAAIRQGDMKYIEFYDTNSQELYDLKTDVRESRNQIAAKPEIAKKLAAELDRWRKSVDAQMMTPNPKYVPNPQNEEGNIPLLSRNATVHGIQLRFEPLPHKNTLGFWTRKEDYATWDFTVQKPGTFEIEILQGCGPGQGGSEVAVEIDEQKFLWMVQDTGGFQSFKPLIIGTVTIEKAGQHSLTLRPQKLAKNAIGDVRQILLKLKK